MIRALAVGFAVSLVLDALIMVGFLRGWAIVDWLIEHDTIHYI